MSKENDGKKIIRRLKNAIKELEKAELVIDRWHHGIVPSLSDAQIHTIADFIEIIHQKADVIVGELGIGN